jgi:hypothetical protein
MVTGMGVVILLSLASILISVIGGCIWMAFSAGNKKGKVLAVLSAILTAFIQLAFIDMTNWIYETIGNAFILYYLLGPILIGAAVYRLNLKFNEIDSRALNRES